MDMEVLSEIVRIVGDVVTAIGLPALGGLMYYDSRKRTEAAKAKQAEAGAKAAEEDIITSYAEQWKHLYEKLHEEKDKRVGDLESKVDRLYDQINDDRKRIRELKDENLRLSLELMKMKIWKCEVKGCEKREPPTGV